MKDYLDYTFSDFIEDENFREWVLQPSEKSQIFWEEFIKTHPEKLKEMVRNDLFRNLAQYSSGQMSTNSMKEIIGVST